MNVLHALINELESHIPDYEQSNTAVSAGTVGWHISHSVLTLQVIIDAIVNSNPGAYKWTFNWKRSLVYTINRIPREKAKAPKLVQPKSDLQKEVLVSQVKQVKERLKALEALSPNHYFNHPYFGQLNLKPSKRFLELHTKHHLKIIKDIVQAKAK
ncbi:MAG TPA: DUF1569 domain-containing protein [Flavipsychrobacter sp.]|nr:DUF1569 domain-containing protein [Flavipsychrobacter sp.]